MGKGAGPSDREEGRGAGRAASAPATALRARPPQPGRPGHRAGDECRGPGQLGVRATERRGECPCGQRGAGESRDRRPRDHARRAHLSRRRHRRRNASGDRRAVAAGARRAIPGERGISRQDRRHRCGAHGEPGTARHTRGTSAAVPGGRAGRDRRQEGVGRRQGPALGWARRVAGHRRHVRREQRQGQGRHQARRAAHRIHGRPYLAVAGRRRPRAPGRCATSHETCADRCRRIGALPVRRHGAAG